MRIKKKAYLLTVFFLTLTILPTFVYPKSFVAGEIILQLTPEANRLVSLQKVNGIALTGIPEIDSVNRKYSVKSVYPLFDFKPLDPALYRKYGLNRTFKFKFPNSANLSRILTDYQSFQTVVYAEPNYLVKATGINTPDKSLSGAGIDFYPNDPFYPEQWAHENTGQVIPSGGGATVGVPDSDLDTDLAWNLHVGDTTIILSIIDTGVDYNHPEFAGRLVPGYDYVNNDADPFDDYGHGTACAGIAAARGNNAMGIAGVNWNCKIMPVKVLDNTGQGEYAWVANGIIFAANNGARVLSLSLSGTDTSSTLENAVNYAYGLNSVIVASRGNENSILPEYPASFPNVIAVGALSPCDERKHPTSCDGETWWGSSYGNDLDFMAPGVRIYTTDMLGFAGFDNGDYYASFNGTSAACPFAAGVAALLASYDTTLTNAQIRTRMQMTSVDIGAPGFDSETGYGRINAYNALLASGSGLGAISVSPLIMNFTIPSGTSDSQFVRISNIAPAGAPDLQWNLSSDTVLDDCAWLSLSATNGSVSAGDTQNVTVLIDASGMFPGNYSCNLILNSSDTLNSQIIIPVNLSVEHGTDFAVTLNVSDICSHSINLVFGTAPDASDDYDPPYDQYAPPPPPGGTFDGRLQSRIDDFFKDIRASISDSIIWKINFRPALGCEPIIFSWNPDQLANEGTFLLTDILGTAIDMRNDSSYTVTIPSLTEMQIKYTLKKAFVQNFIGDWNLLGLPLNTIDKFYKSVYPDAMDNTLFGFDGSYVQEDSLTIGRGYWLKFPAAGQVAVMGFPETSVTVNLMGGWNIISGGIDCNIAASEIIDPNGILVPGTLFGFSGSYFVADSVIQGNGYWVRADSAGQIILNCSARSSGETGQKIAKILDPSQFPAIKISDASGAEQMLYFDVNLDNPETKLSFSMPPLPPPGAFDARFEGNYRISENNGAIIQVQSSHYPVSVTLANVSDPNSGTPYLIEEILSGSKNKVYPLLEGKEVQISNPGVRKIRLIKTGERVPLEFTVSQNYPNPFNPTTTIGYTIPTTQRVEIVVYNTLGQVVRRLLNEVQEPGVHEITWDAKNEMGRRVGSGVYYYLVKADDQSSVKKMLLLK